MIEVATYRDVERLEGVRLVLLDFDGVLTDNRVIVREDGTESVVCHRGDGWGIARLRDAGIQVVVVSTEVNPVVSARCAKLRVRCFQDVRDKTAAVRALIAEYDVPRESVVYVGNDLNDIGAMREVGMPVSVADGHRGLSGVARYVTDARGGYGAVREVAEAIVDCRPTWEAA